MAEAGADGPVLSLAEQRRLARALSDDVAWPLIALIPVLPALYAALCWAALSGLTPLWAMTPPLAYLAYAHYLLVHEGAHGNLVRRGRWSSPVHELGGWIGSLALGSTWPVLRRTHLGHHRALNRDDDPDIYVRGSLGRLVLVWAAMGVTDHLPLDLTARISRHYARARGLLTRSERWQVRLGQLLHWGVFVAAIGTGHAREWLLLVFLPQRGGALILHVLLQWAPHAPFETGGRYVGTRIVRWPRAKGLVLIENLHLLHHLWPSVPFYRLGTLYAALLPTLRRQGIRFETFLPATGPDIRPDLSPPAPTI